MSDDYNERRADAASEGYGPEDRRRFANSGLPLRLWIHQQRDEDIEPEPTEENHDK